MDKYALFIQERQYLMNVSPKTVEYYRWAFKSYEDYGKGDPKQWVITLRARGVSPRTVNTYIRALNTYWKWAGESHHLPYLKDEQKILATFRPEQVKAFVHFKPQKRWERQVHTVCLLLLDTGLRINEALSLTKEDVDYDNLVFKVVGKGGKHRLVPMSLELRRTLFKFAVQTAPRRYLFRTQHETKLSQRNFLRDLKKLGQKLGIAGVRLSPNTFRHTFAVNYLRAGGNLYYLQRILGHSSINTTQLYLRSLGVDDLRAVHDEISLLSNR